MIRFNLNASNGCTWILSDYLYNDDDFEGSPPPDMDTIKRLMVKDASAYPSWYHTPSTHPPLEVDVNGTTMYGYLCHIAPYVQDCICTLHLNGQRSVMILCSDDCLQSLFYSKEEAIADAEILDKATENLRRNFRWDGEAGEFLNKVRNQGDEILDVIRLIEGIIEVNDDVNDDNDDTVMHAEFVEMFK